jgi:hypothetical protein
VNLGHGITFGILRLELFVELLRLELLVLLLLYVWNFTFGIIYRIITIGSIIIRGGKLNKRVFYYSVELFCLILLDYSVWKMYQTNFFHFFPEGKFF